jgi:hypothetical protein
MPFDFDNTIQGALGLLAKSAQPAQMDTDTSYLTPSAIEMGPGYSRRAALAGLLGPTHSGSTAEGVANSMAGENAADLEQAKLRAMYLPAIANAVTSRQQAAAQANLVNVEAAQHMIGAAQAARAADIQRWALGQYGYDSGQADQIIPQLSQGALSQGAAQGDVGPTNTNAQRMTGALSAMAPQRPSGMMFGVPSDVALSDLAFNGGKNIAGFANERSKPTPDVINAQYAMGGDGAGAQNLVLAKLMKEGIVTMRNGLLYNTLTGQFMGAPAAMIQKNAEAVKRGETLGGTTTTVNPDGSESTAIFGDLYTSPGGNPNAPAPIRNNNPGALMPGGKLAQFKTPEEGLAAMDQNLQSYGKQGVKTLSGVIAKWAPPNENDTQAYIADVSKRLGVDPNAPVDLNNPLQRHAISTAIMLHENGPQAVFGQPAAQATPTPVGVQTKAAPGVTSARAQGDKFYEQIASEGQSVGQDRNILEEMAKLANDPNAKFGPGAEGVAAFKAKIANIPGLPDSWKADVQQAQTYQDVLRKLASNMAMGRLGQGSTGTDTQLETLLHSFPNGEMTPAAMKQVLPMLQRQVDARETRLNAASNFLKAHGNDRQYMQDFNQAWSKFGDPVAIEVGRQLAIAQSRGDKNAAATLIAKIKADPDLTAKIKGLNSLGAF